MESLLLSSLDFLQFSFHATDTHISARQVDKKRLVQYFNIEHVLFSSLKLEQNASSYGTFFLCCFETNSKIF